MNSIKKYFAVVLALSVLLVGCKSNNKTTNSASNETNDGTTKTIYTTIYPIYDFTKKIVGDKMNVVYLESGNQSAHDFEPSAEDMKNITNADLFIYNGAGLESYIDKVKSAINKDIKFVEASEGVSLLANHEEHDHDHEDEDHDHNHEGEDHNHNNHNNHNHNNHNNHNDHNHDNHNHDNGNHNENNHNHDEHEHGHHHHHHGPNDPHVWLSPKNAQIMLKNITDAVVALDEENKDFYEENLKKYTDELTKLDSEYKDGLANIKSNEIVVSHEAFGYLCNEYGLTQKGIEGVMAVSEPDAKTIKEIIELVKEKGIKIIFTEEAMNPKIVETISKETGAEVRTLNPIEGISEDDMNKGVDYFSIMRDNLKNLEEALN